MHGHGKKVYKYFELMCEGVQLDDIIFVYLLSTCNHAALVDEEMHCYSMGIIHMIFAKLEHYTCMVDLFGCASYLQEATGMVRRCPKPHVSKWKPLLGACRIHGDVEMGEHVVNQILELEPENALGYVLSSNVLSMVLDLATFISVRKLDGEERKEEV